MSELVDRTFWKRLEMFIANVQVNDMMSEEEKEYILLTAKRNIDAQSEFKNLPQAFVSSSKPTVKDGITTYPDGSRYNERGQGICNKCDMCYEFIRSCDDCGYTDGKHW